MGETLMLSFFAFLLALLAVRFFLPTLSTLVDQRLSFSLVENWPLTLYFVSVFLLAGILAGTYPALVASRFRPAEIFNNSVGRSGGNAFWLASEILDYGPIFGWNSTDLWNLDHTFSNRLYA